MKTTKEMNENIIKTCPRTKWQLILGVTDALAELYDAGVLEMDERIAIKIRELEAEIEARRRSEDQLEGQNKHLREQLDSKEDAKIGGWKDENN